MEEQARQRQRNPSLAIVGAGIAGLTAAPEILQDYGIDQELHG